MVVAVRNRQRTVRLLTDAVSDFVRTALRFALAKTVPRGHRADTAWHVEVSVMFVNDRTMRAFNRDYRAKDKTTDVLSFPQIEDSRTLAGMIPGFSGDGQIALGDIVISIPQAVRQAAELHVSLSDEISRLLVHGVLHLVGYDHERSISDDHAMRRFENSILRRIGKNPLCLN